MADSCAAKKYHQTMVDHGVGDRSQLHILTGDKSHCGCLGQAGGDGVPAADRFARFCNVLNQTCLNHTQAFPAMVAPAAAFLKKAFADVKSDDESAASSVASSYDATASSFEKTPVLSYLTGSSTYQQSFNPSWVQASAGTGDPQRHGPDQDPGTSAGAAMDTADV